MENIETVNKIIELLKEDLDNIPKDSLFGKSLKDYDEDIKNYDTSEILYRWQELLNNSNPEMTGELYWHEPDGIYKLPGLLAIRNNKENPHTIDMLFENGTCYYKCYPTSISGFEGTEKDGVYSITVKFESLNQIEDIDMTFDIE